MKEFKNKVALITGAGNGFGFEFTKEAVRRGMKLMLADIDAADLERTKQWVLEQGGTVETEVADLSLEEDADRLVRRTMETYGQIDLLMNNAGIAFGGLVTDLPSREWEWIFHINCMSHIYTMKRVIPIMEKQGTPCHILNVTSLAGLLTMGDMPSYYATKHFSTALAESEYYDLQRTGINNIKMSVFCPSYVHTDLHHYERHRPERYKIPADDPYYTSEAYKNELKKAEHVITTGSPVDTVGPLVFENIEKENFYIQMHPNTKPLIRHRMRDILKERNPDFRFTYDISGLVEGRVSLKSIWYVLTHL